MLFPPFSHAARRRLGTCGVAGEDVHEELRGDLGAAVVHLVGPRFLRRGRAAVDGRVAGGVDFFKRGLLGHQFDSVMSVLGNNGSVWTLYLNIYIYSTPKKEPPVAQIYW